MPRKPTGNPAGRPKGSKNKQPLDVKELAQDYTAQAIEALAMIMTAGKQEAARVAAANAILDRGHGKARQAVDVEHDVGERLAELIRAGRQRAGRD